MFGQAHRLFALIPRIYDIARLSWCQASDLELRYLVLLSGIRSWEATDGLFIPDGLLAGRLYQQAMLIYLELAFHGPQNHTDCLISKVQEYITTFLEHLGYLAHDSTAWTISMWPSLVAGSCMRRAADRDQLLRAMGGSSLKFPVVAMVSDVLRSHWKALDQDPSLYGPHGMDANLKRNDIVLCIG